MKEKEIQLRQVIHLHLLSTDEHLYFGSIQAIFESLTREQVGVATQTLYNRGLDDPYINDKVIIRKGQLIQKRKSK